MLNLFSKWDIKTSAITTVVRLQRRFFRPFPQYILFVYSDVV